MLKNIKKPVYLALAGGIGCMVLALVAELFLLFFSSAPQEPQYVCLTIDISGSMDGNKLGDVKQAANIFIDKRGEDNYLALTVFGSYGNELVPFSQDKDKLHTEINRLQAWGGTNFEDAMRISSNSILAKGNSQRDVKEVSHNNSALLIFTDGENSMGDPRIAIQIANELRKRGVRIYAIATQDCDFLFLEYLTGNRDHVIATDDGRIEQAFEQAEKMISSQLMETSGSSVNPLIGLLRVCLWTFFLCLGIALGLVGMQNAFLEKKMFTVPQSLNLAFWAILAGCVAGGAGQLLFSLVSSGSSSGFMLDFSRIIAWAILGAVMARIMVWFIPNLSIRWALRGGAFGGCFGAIGFMFFTDLLKTTGSVGDVGGRLVGAFILGAWVWHWPVCLFKTCFLAKKDSPQNNFSVSWQVPQLRVWCPAE